jgi:PadR family transcriptional regulator PadR
MKDTNALKKGSAEMLILSALEPPARRGKDIAHERHGYDIAQLIERESEGAVTFYAASLYPLLYRLEKREWITGRWTVSNGRRRRMYRITPAGKKALAAQRSRWRAFARAINRLAIGRA